MKLPRNFFKPLAIGAPMPLRELPVQLERMIHFVPPHIEKLRLKVPELIAQVDVVLGNLEDAIPADAKEAARRGFIQMAAAGDFGATGLWTRINALNSPWGLDDVVEIVGAVGNKLDVVMLPKVEGAWDIHYLDQLLAQLEAKHQLKKPILIHAILETAEGVQNVASIATASPRMHGISLGPADLAASRAMKTTRVGGGHPDYKVLADAAAEGRGARAFQQDLWHYTIAKMVDACAACGIKPFYGPFGDFSDPLACEAQFRNAFLMGCAGAWSLHPTQVPIAKRVFSPEPAEVAFAKRIVDAMPDGTGAVMIDGKMQDDATWKQAKVLLDLARLVAAKDPDMGPRYGPQRRALILDYAHGHEQNPYRPIQSRPGGPAPPVSVPRRGLRYRSGIQQYRGVVPIHPGRGAPAQGPAVLSSVRGERGERVHRLCVGAESAAGHFRRAGAPSAGRRGVRKGSRWRLPAAGLVTELTATIGTSRRSAAGKQSILAPERILQRMATSPMVPLLLAMSRFGVAKR